jgi:hypothetical protein
MSRTLSFPGVVQIDMPSPRGAAEIEVPTTFKPISASSYSDNMGDIWLVLSGLEAKADSSGSGPQQELARTKTLEVRACNLGDDVPEGSEFIAVVPAGEHSYYLFVSDVP